MNKEKTLEVFEIIDRNNLDETDKEYLISLCWEIEDLKDKFTSLQNELDWVNRCSMIREKEHFTNYKRIQESLNKGKVSDLDNVSFFAAQQAVKSNSTIESFKDDIFN